MRRFLNCCRMIPCLILVFIHAQSAALNASEVASSDAAEGEKFFVEHVEPIFVQNCYRCHGNGTNRGGLTFYTREGLLEGGESGAAYDPDSPEYSLILDAVNFESFEMPPSGKLPEDKIALIRKWIEMGAPIPERTDVIEVEHEGIPEVNEETKNHWSFRLLERPQIPEHEDQWGSHPIDAFVLDKLQQAELTPNPPADRQALVRRVYYDLIGLPPTMEEVQDFLTDDSPDAYSKLVDRLLDSPQYGEHWARYWLDLVRYAESNSFERDGPKPFVWKYRDYVIRAFNDDLPYNEFVLQQLAGDELDEVTPESLIATGFYRLGMWDDEPADPKLAVYDELDDIITTTGQGLLGLTINCARCHDHKLDPISQADYYKFLSFFHNVKPYGIRSDKSVHDHSVGIITPADQLERFEKEINDHKQKQQQLTTKIGALDEQYVTRLPGGERDDFKTESLRVSLIEKHHGTLYTSEEVQEYVDLRNQLAQLAANTPPAVEQALIVKEFGKDPKPTHVLIRGNAEAEGNVVTPEFPEILSPPEPQIVPSERSNSSGRRLALAKWIVDPANPLTSRVMVNRLWQWHFNRGIVASSSNFGLQGDLPTHPELLDWLASEFIEQGWSIKAMHRLILNSRTYQMSSAFRQEAYDKDPQNLLYWRFDMRRLRAEEVRDSILAVNQTLDRDTMFGPSIYPTLPAAVLAGQSRPGENWHTSPPEKQRRRSIYIHIKRSVQVPLLASFDVADTDFTCPIRFATTQPTQALGMLNSEYLNEQAQAFADSLQDGTNGDLHQQVTIALRRVTQREPTIEEVETGLRLIETLQKNHDQSTEEALRYFCLMALNLNEFLYLD